MPRPSGVTVTRLTRPGPRLETMQGSAMGAPRSGDFPSVVMSALLGGQLCSRLTWASIALGLPGAPEGRAVAGRGLCGHLPPALLAGQRSSGSRYNCTDGASPALPASFEWTAHAQRLFH